MSLESLVQFCLLFTEDLRIFGKGFIGFLKLRENAL